MLDRYVYGTVERISAEAPIPIVRVNRQASMLGGVGNVARNIASAGGSATLLAAAGDDGAGGELAALVADSTAIEAHLAAEPGRPTTVKTRYVAAGQQLLRADGETTVAIAPATSTALVEQLQQSLTDADVLVLSDYAKGVLTDDLLRATIDCAQKAGKPVVADPKRQDFSAYAGVDYLKPNRSELAAATGLPCDSDDEVTRAATEVIQQCRIGAVLVSRSEQGISLIPARGDPVHLPVRAPEVFDVSGAGDTVVAVFAMALAAGAMPADAAHLANLAAAIVVGKVGTAAVGRDELAAAVLAEEVSSSEDKIVSADAALADVERWKSRGLKVGFTNGCFDLLHPGHISLLQEAKGGCDRLLVAINSDASARRLKGPDRPVQNEAARALVLASLSVVDRVLIFADATPIPLLQRLRPDVLIKGGDYAIDQVVGGDIVQGYGGAVKLAAFQPGHSSSKVISRMADGDPDDAETKQGSG